MKLLVVGGGGREHAIIKKLKQNPAVVAPDDPLVLGAVDALEEAGVPCFGPRASFGAVSAPGGVRRAPLRVLCPSGS